MGLTMRACSVFAHMVSDEATYPGTSLFPVNHRHMSETVDV